MSAAKSDSLQRIVRILSEKGPMRAGDLGFEMWGTKATCCKCENAQATMFIRPATKMLYRAEALGLVRWREHGGRSRMWYANATGERPETRSEDE